MAGEDNVVRIIGSDSERPENGEMGEEEHRSESEVKVKSEEEEEEGEEREGIKSVEEGERMDEGGWAWVVVLGESIYSQVPQENFS